MDNTRVYSASGRHMHASSSDITSPSLETLKDLLFEPVENGTVVVLSINMAKTCEAFDIPYDLELQEEFRALEVKSYVAVIDRTSFWPQNRWCTCELNFISQGFPQPREEYREDNSMCVPIFPTIAHPKGRVPVRLAQDMSLPWADCYQSTVQRAQVVVTNVHRENASSMAFPKAEAFTNPVGFWRYRFEDENRIETLSKNRSCSPEPPLSLTFPPLYSKASSSRHSLEDPFGFDNSKDGPEANFRMSMLSGDLEEEFRGILGMFKTAPKKIHVDVWYDLSRISAPPAPRDFLDERDKVYELLHRAQRRIRSLPMSGARYCQATLVPDAWPSNWMNDDEQTELMEYHNQSRRPRPALRRSKSASTYKIQRSARGVLLSLKIRFAGWLRRRRRSDRF